MIDKTTLDVGPTNPGEPISDSWAKASYAFHQFPSPVGWWALGPSSMETCFAVYSRPTDQQIKNTEEMLGWKWREV